MYVQIPTGGVNEGYTWVFVPSEVPPSISQIEHEREAAEFAAERHDAEKQAKAAVDYGEGMPQSHCGICKQFIAPDGCTVVEGTIRAEDWCKLFVKREGRADAEVTTFAPSNGDPQGRAAGVMFFRKADRGDEALFVKHRERGTWEFPGGTIEEGESAESAALREVGEEIGAVTHGKMSMLMRDRLTGVDYSTFQARVADAFEPTLNEELADFAWLPMGDPPEPLHPGVRLVLERVGMDELDIARAIAQGRLSSPQQYENLWLFALRVTGTGASYRPELNEHVWRDPGLYLNDDFLARCNGLPVIWQHPPDDVLNQQEFENRIIGALMLPYIVDDEVWAVARIYDQVAAQLMLDYPLSTSPDVMFRDPEVNESRKLEGGKTLLIEGKPSLLDHLAICSLGVWDKSGEPTGIAKGEPIMADAELLPDVRVDHLERLSSIYVALSDMIDRLA
jgi:8-oxo-dGTP pyrophosphatase MutT (NUDIX family)